MSDELLLFEVKPAGAELKPHEWGHWKDEPAIPVSDGVEWRANGFGGHDLIIDDEVALGYVKRVTVFRSQLNDFETYYVAFSSNSTVIGTRSDTALEARQRVLRWLDENRQGWRNQTKMGGLHPPIN